MYTREELIKDLHSQPTFMDIVRWFDAFEPELIEMGNSLQGSRSASVFFPNSFSAARREYGWHMPNGSMPRVWGNDLVH